MNLASAGVLAPRVFETVQYGTKHGYTPGGKHLALCEQCPRYTCPGYLQGSNSEEAERQDY